MFSSEDVAVLQRRHGLSYHVAFALEAQQRVGLGGKDVIEIGGSLPRDFVLGTLGASRWIAVEETGYWDEVARVEAEASKSWTGVRPLSEAGASDLEQTYAVLTGRIEQAPSALDRRFDVAFSIAAFEHIDRLPEALEAIHRVLRPGGLLFTIFSPVWSASDGHHLPQMLDGEGRPFDRALIPPWGHLLMRPPEMHRHLCRRTDPRTASEAVYYIYNSPHINRLFAEDYIAYVQDSPFEVEKLAVLFPDPIDAATQATLERLHPGRAHFATRGLMMILRRRGAPSEG